MPFFNVVGDEVVIRNSSDNNSEKSLAVSVKKLQQSQLKDVIIHCKDGKSFSTNKLILAIGSPFLRNIFAGLDQCCDAIRELIFPDFSMEAIKKLVNFFHTGTISVCSQDSVTIDELKAIMRTLRVTVNISSMQVYDKNEALSHHKTSENHGHLPGHVDSTRLSLANEVPTFGKESQSLASKSFLFSCQFCNKQFQELFDLSQHIQGHVLDQDQAEVEMTPAKEPDRRCNVTVKLEPQERNDSDDFAVTENNSSQVLSNSDSVSSCGKRLHPENVQSVQKYTQSDCHQTKSNLNKLINKLILRKEKRPQSAFPEPPTYDCVFCQKTISSCAMQVSRHLAVSHYAKKLIRVFGPPKSDCPICRKKLANRRGWLAHLLVLHTNLPNTMKGVKEAELRNPGFIDQCGEDDEIVEERPAKSALRQRAKEEKRMSRQEEKLRRKEEIVRRKEEEKSMMRQEKRMRKEEEKSMMRQEKRMRKEEEKSTTRQEKRMRKEQGINMKRQEETSRKQEERKETREGIKLEKSENEGNEIKNRVSFSCPRCPVTLTTYQALVVHATECHLDDVKDFLLPNIENNENCKLCSKKYRNFGSLAYHLAKAHRLLDSFLTNTEEDESSLGEAHNSVFSEQMSTYHCPKCPEVMESSASALTHLGIAHFTELILPHVKTDNVCGFCDQPFTKVGPLAYHLLTAHGIAKDSIPSINSLKQQAQEQKLDNEQVFT